MADYLKKLQDPAFRQEAIAAYVDDPVGITSRECKEFRAGYDCFLDGEKALMAVLPPDEKDRILQARARWLGERFDINLVHGSFNWDRLSFNNQPVAKSARQTLDELRARDIWEALKALGPYGAPWFQSARVALEARVFHPDNRYYTGWKKSLEIAGLLVFDAPSLARTFAWICLEKQGDATDLVTALLDDKTDFCAWLALEELSQREDFTIPTEGFGLIRQVFSQLPKEEEGRKRFAFELLKKMERPNAEALNFLEEIYAESDLWTRYSLDDIWKRWGSASAPSLIRLAERGSLSLSDLEDKLINIPVDSEGLKQWLRLTVREKDKWALRGVFRSISLDFFLDAYGEAENEGRIFLLESVPYFYPPATAKKRFVSVLLRDLQSPEGSLRRAAANFMNRDWMYPAVRPFLPNLLTEDHPDPVRLNVVDLLYNDVYQGIHSSDIKYLFLLTSLLAAPNPELRWQTAFLLGKMGEQAIQALPFLYTMSRNDADERCRATAFDAMEMIEENVP